MNVSSPSEVAMRQSQSTTPDVMSADEVAAFLRLDRKTVYSAAATGEIPCRRLGRRLLFFRRALESWLETPANSASTRTEP